MPKFEFIRNAKKGLIIDEISFKNKNESLGFASKMLKNDLELKEVLIIQIEPKDQYRVIIDRLRIIRTHFKIKESDYDSITSKIGNNHRAEDEKKINILNKGGVKPNNNGTDHKK